MKTPLPFFVHTLFFFLLFFASQHAGAQSGKVPPPPDFVMQHAVEDGFRSAHYDQMQFYRQQHLQTEAQYDSLNALLWGEPPAKPGVKNGLAKANGCTLNKAVYGWHPYWVGSGAYNNYDYSLLSTFCYFSYELDPATGSYTDIHAWKTSSSIDLAQAAGCKVELCVTNFGGTNNTTFLTNPAAWDVFIDSMKVLLDYRNADGVNIDFEGIPGSQRDNLSSFMQYLSNRLKTERPGSTVTMELFAVDWNNVFDLPALDPYVDQFIVMGYGYHYGGSSQAGPVAPLHHGGIWGTNTLSRTVDYYLNEGTTPSKLLMGLPYYGYEWDTQSGSVPSSTTSGGVSRTYSYLRNNYYGTYTYQWDSHSETPYFAFQSGGVWNQCWFDDEISLAERYDMILDKKIGGMGIWALGYDNGYPDLWNAIESRFTDCNTICSNQNYDTGGPLGQYLNNENTEMTFSKPDASSITLTFNSFDLEADYDYLHIYDGPDSGAPLMGTYTGTASPGVLTSSGNAITIKFTSDGATRADGWDLSWECNQCDLESHIEPLPGWQTTDFGLSTNDSICNQSVDHNFYLVCDLDNSQWRSNAANGYFNDDFGAAAIHPDWSVATGTWAQSAGAMEQSDENEGNTNIYAPVQQDSQNVYLYHWRAKMDGSGSNRRSGIHFFSDDGSLPNRGNGYFIYFRADNDKVQIYKVENDVWDLKTDDALTVNAGEWYDFKVLFDPASGQVKAFMNDALASSWIDAAPYTSGGYVSLRTGNCIAQYDFLRVYKAGANPQTVSVGGAPSSDLQQQSANPSESSGRIYTTFLTAANAWGSPDTAEVKVDYTPPAAVPEVNDGTGADEDSTGDFGSLSANWAASNDPHSGVAAYWYAVGTTPGGNGFVDWTYNGLATNFTQSGLSLMPGTTYYVSVRAVNGAGLEGPVSTSDGIQTSPPVTAKLKLWLQGAYNVANGQMNTNLNQANLLPLSQPFGGAPWYHSPDVVVASMPADAVDWVLVEARDAANPQTVLERRPALLYKNGTVWDVDGSEGVKFYSLTQNQSYLLSVRSRNHVDVVAAAAVQLPNALAYDFTQMGAAMGTDQLALLATGVYGLKAGDFVPDGVCTVADYNEFKANMSQLNVYNPCDANLDGFVTVSDLNLFIANSGQIGVALVRY